MIRGERLPNEQQDKVPSGGEAEKEPKRGTPPALRCTKDLVEEALFESHRNLFSSLSKVEWNRAMREPDEITLRDIRHNNKGYQLRSDVRSNASILLRAAGVKLPPTLSPTGDTAS